MAQHELRDYQEAGIDNLRAALTQGDRRIMFQLPTGAGKTATAAAIIRSAVGKGKRVIFTVPALSLITQTVESFKRDGIRDIGVIQGIHELTDKDQPVQICSVQTLARRFVPKVDLVIIDEAHVVFKLYERWFNEPEWASVPIIGLSATPWTKGLSKLYQRLVIGTTTQELIDNDILSTFRVFAPSHVNLDDVKTVAGDYDLEGLDKAMNQPKLVADIVDTWLNKASDRPTLIYAVNRAHAKNIADAFNAVGIACGYMDGNTPVDERDDMCESFRNGDLKIIANIGVLTTGVDLPFVSCLVLARPTKSEMLYVQIIGRGLRKADGKDDCMILDHSDTTARLGFVTDIHHKELNDGKKNLNGLNKQDKEPLPKECPACTYLRPAKMSICPNCGFEPKPMAGVVVVDGRLVEVSGAGDAKTFGKAAEPAYQDQERFYRELLGYAMQKNFKSGWAFHQFKAKFKINPDPMFRSSALSPTPSTLNYIKHLWIKRNKAQQKALGAWGR
jgi:DNA repair protein RadD